MPRAPRFFGPLAGAILVCVLFGLQYLLLQANLQQQQSDKLQHLAMMGIDATQQRLEQSLDMARVLSNVLPAGAGSPTRAALDGLARNILSQNTAISGVALIQRIAGKDRERFERSTANPLQILNQHRLMPAPVRNGYYPVIHYVPDDPDGLPNGLDLGGNPGWPALFDDSQHGNVPVLARHLDTTGGQQRLAILVPLQGQDSFLMLVLNLEPVLDMRLPEGGSLLRKMRIVAWESTTHNGPRLLLDSHPALPLPTTPPLLTTRRNIGQLNIQFGVYDLSPAAPFSPLSDRHAQLVLLQSLLVSALFMLLLSRLYRSNQHFRFQLTRQNLQLEDNNRTLRQQVAERAQTAQALRESEARQRAILQASSDTILLINREGLVTDVNPAAAALIGQSLAALDKIPIGSLLFELYDPTRSRPFESVAESLGTKPFEAHLIRGDATHLPVELSLSRVEVADEVFFVVVCRDIRERKEQEAALIRLKNSLTEQVEVQRRQLAALLDASPLAMAYIADRCLKQVNRAFLDLFECDEESCLNKSTRQFYESDEQWERTGRTLYNLLNEGKVVKTELKLYSGHGKMFWCRLYGKAVNPSVPGLGTIWLYQDFSTERAAADALRSAKELAEDTSRAKTEFLANMSHELRTPMHAILGFAEMGQNRIGQVAEDKIRHYFERIHSSGSRLLTLLNDLLDLAKMEAGRMEYTFASGDIARCLAEACDELNGFASRTGIRLMIDCSPTPMMAEFDALRIGQVMRNLLSNAIKFSPPDHPVYIRARIGGAPDQETIEISVTDHGPGIPAMELETIFDKFMQSTTTKTGAGGTGLGLAICREIMYAHQGMIRAGNDPDGGAIFSLTLPRGSGAR